MLYIRSLKTIYIEALKMGKFLKWIKSLKF